jgi:T5SS/PEP-CTERM-associated repeat protein
VLVTGAGSLWTNYFKLNVGNDGSSNSLVISNGGKVADFSGYIGSNSLSSNNSALVTGSGSLWTNSDSLSVGSSGKNNRLVISDGGNVVSGRDGYLGAGVNSSNNSALVTGSASLWTVNTNLHVGFAGNNNSLVISNGATVASMEGYLGADNTFASNNSALVTGAGSLWTNSANLYAGFGGKSNSLTIADGGKVASATGVIGNNSSSSGNSAVVTGAGSLWTNSNEILVGNVGSGTITVADGVCIIRSSRCPWN